jgi:hypothetical protein
MYIVVTPMYTVTPSRYTVVRGRYTGKPYSQSQSEDVEESVFAQLDAWTDELARFVTVKGKVPEGRYPAAGYTPRHHRGHHRWADLKLAWRDRRTRADHPPADSSPAAQ